MFMLEFKKHYKGLIGWSIGMFTLISLSMVKGDAFIATNDASDIMDIFPTIMSALFGMNPLIEINTPFGYYSVLFIYLVIALSIYGIISTVGTFSKEDSDKTYEYLMVKPVSKFKIFAIKNTVAFLNIIILNIVVYFSGLIFLYKYIPDTPDLLFQFTMLSINMFMIVLFIIGMTYIVMGLFKTTKHMLSVGMIFIVISYIINVFATIFPENELLHYLTPFQIFGPLDIINGTINYFAYIFVIVILLIGILLHYRFFAKREF